MRRVLIAGAMVAILPWAAPLAAQQRDFPIEPGQRVRLEAPTLFESWQVDEVVRIGRDSLFLRNGEPIPINALHRLQVSVRNRSHAGNGAWIGAIGGLAAGVATGLILQNSYSDTPAEAVVAGFAGIGAIGGALIGLTVGSARHTDVWEGVPLVKRPMIAAQRNGSAGAYISVNLHF